MPAVWCAVVRASSYLTLSYPSKVSETLYRWHNANSHGITTVVRLYLPTKAGGAAAQILAGGGRPCMTNGVFPRLPLGALEPYG